MNCGLFELKCHAKNMLVGWLGDVAAWIDGIVPFGWYGVAFILGIVVGERFGKWAYGLVVAIVTLRFMDRQKAAASDDDDEIFRHEDPKPVRRSSQKPPKGKRVRTIFDMLGKR